MVIKRDGTKEEFSFGKIEKAVSAAFEAVRMEQPEEWVLKKIYAKLKRRFNKIDEIKIEQISDEIENILMHDEYEDVAKAFIIYRYNHKKVRDYAQKKIDFINNYKASDNTANATIDDNSNVANKNIAILNSEIHKEENMEVNLKMLENKVRKLYPDFDYKQLIKDLKSICYLHDASSQIGMPYTYSAKEVVEVLYNSKNLLVPLDLLYDIVDEKETLVNPEKEVYQKTPWHLYVKDKENKWTNVTKLTRKRRHRPLVRVKTAFGEDLVVTDNHPMITDIENIENTIQAADSQNSKQYRIGTTLEFKGRTTIDLKKVLPTWIDTDNVFIKYYNTMIKKVIQVDRKLGYLIGFFVGDGGYNNTNKSIAFTQKDKSVLLELNDLIYEIFGTAGIVRKSTDKKQNCYVLQLSNVFIFELFRNFFKIQDKAQNKTLPYNILEFNEDFAKGCLEGLIDADGSVRNDDCNISIRISSRACVLQCTYLFRHFGYGVGNSIQSLPFSNNSSYNTNYTIWGINATKREDSAELNNSKKVRENLINSKSSALKYKPVGYCTISDVSEIEPNSAFYELNEFIYDITTETHTFCSNNILVHNCAAISMYPFLNDGLKKLGGLSAAPKNLDSFCGMFCNLVFLIASQYKGAVATPALLLYMDYFCRKEWGDDYYKHLNGIISSPICTRQLTIQHQIHQYFQQICYTLMQPSGGRGNQSVFWNVSIFDKPFYDTMYSDFWFPDETQPVWESFNWLQKEFLHWLNQERLKTILTFPVVSVCLIYQDGKFLDEELYDYACKEYAEGNSFFTYISDSADSLSSCCRLSSKIEKPQFNFTNGQLSEMTGSKNVITLNMNRIVQDWAQEYWNKKAKDFLKMAGPEGNINNIPWVMDTKEGVDDLQNYLINILERIYKYQTAYNACLTELKNAHLLPVYDAGFIDMRKQYLTIGINGLNQAAEFLGMKCSKNYSYQKFCNLIFSTIKEQNQKHKTKDLMFNTEFTPCESAAIKLYNRDKADGYWVPNDTNLYASYIFKPNDAKISILDKLAMHGRAFCGDYLDGGSAAHLNLDSHLSEEQYRKLLHYAAEIGCKYFTFNVPNSECDDCGYITKVPIEKCPKCGSTHISYYDRVIGYLTKISNWSKGRQEEQKTRVYQNLKDKEF